MNIHLIWAQTPTRDIGFRGSIPWHLPEDLLLFRARTMGATVVMGRATWDSLPERVRPLPGRRNRVLTRQPGWHQPGAEPSTSVDELLDAAAGEDLWCIGGGEIYHALLPHATHIVATTIDREINGDTFAPILDVTWLHTTRGQWQTSATGLRYRVDEYRRRGTGGLA